MVLTKLELQNVDVLVCIFYILKIILYLLIDFLQN